MLRYLLDEHLSPAIAAQINARRPEVPIVALRAWQEGTYLRASDSAILAAAHARGRTLVTCDVHTIAPLLKVWSERGTKHGGVVLVHSHPLPTHAIGSLVRALVRLWDDEGDMDWTDHVVFLRR